MVEDSLRILEKIEDKPNLRMVAEARGLGAVRPVVAMATSENEKFWARKAAGMSKHTLETYVREYKKQGGVIDMPRENNSALEFRPGTEILNTEEEPETVKAEGAATSLAVAGENAEKTAGAAVNHEAVTLSMTLDPKTAEALQKLKGRGDWNTLMQELLRLREEKLEAEAPEPVMNANRYIPARIKRHVIAKTNGQCAYPGCNKAYDILHHTQRFALQPTHDSKTLVPLCKGHEQMAHQGLIEWEQEPAAEWRVREEAERGSALYAVDRRVMSYRAHR